MPHFTIEHLEPRQLLALPLNINISKMPGNQSEGAITIDPNNPSRVFAVSNIDVGDGLMTYRSTDGGQTWSKRLIADGDDDLEPACCDGSAVFDEFGNLYVSYMDAKTELAVMILSTDGGATFEPLKTWSGDVDQPTTTAGFGSVWITFEKDNRIVATGAPVDGLGDIGDFLPLQRATGSNNGNFGDIALGPNGRVVVTYLTPSDTDGPAEIFINIDPDGLGKSGFGAARLVTSTNVGGFREIPAQTDAEIDAEPGLAIDNTGGARNGRIYMVYTDASRTRRDDTNIRLRFSDDDGITWSKSFKVNTDSTTHSQFLPRIALDQTTGNLAISWYDNRSDNGKKNRSSNRAKNDDAHFFAVAARPTAGGVKFSPNFRVSAGFSNARRANNAIDLGDYTGLAFHEGNFFPLWSDNSNSTDDNPTGRLRRLDMYLAKIPMPVIA